MNKSVPNDDGKKRICVFCKTDEDNVCNLGEFMSTGKTYAHYFCVLLSWQIKQDGEDDEGIYGFLERDIIMEVERGKKCKCSLCFKCGATLQCATRSCKRSFHLPCHIKANFRIDFTTFKVFCKTHSYRSKLKLRKMLKEWKDKVCTVCQEITFDENTVIYNICCGKLLHRDCAKNLARNSGYFTKCPTCNSTEKFVKNLEENGVFVPCRDASWELEENAFQELDFVYRHCDALICECPRGRDYDGTTSWGLIRCMYCGSSTVHKKCASIESIYICPSCQS